MAGCCWLDWSATPSYADLYGWFVVKLLVTFLGLLVMMVVKATF